MSESGRKALRYARELLGGPPGCPGVVGRSYRKFGSGREDVPEVREWSGGPPECPGVIGSPSRMSRSGR